METKTGLVEISSTRKLIECGESAKTERNGTVGSIPVKPIAVSSRDDAAIQDLRAEPAHAANEPERDEPASMPGIRRL